MGSTKIFVATHYNTLQHAETSSRVLQVTNKYAEGSKEDLFCNSLQLSATRCNTLQHAATRSRVLQAAGECTEGGKICIATLCNTRQHSATCCNTLTCVLSLRQMCWRREDPLSFPRRVSAPLTTSNFDLISGVRVCVCVC